MKKLFLLTALGSVGIFSASAQKIEPSSIMLIEGQNNAAIALKPSAENSNDLLSKEYVMGSPSSSKYQKTTVGGSRWYNYIEHLNKKDAALLGTAFGATGSRYGIPMMWNNPKSFMEWTSGIDTIQIVSIGNVFDPTFPEYNLAGAAPTSAIAVTKTNSYTLDSVRVWGAYFRNPAKTAIVDTLRLAVVYGRESGSNMFTKNYNYPGSMATFGVDRAYFPPLFHDTVANRATSLTTAPMVVVFNIPITAAMLNDTALIPGAGTAVNDGWNVFSADLGKMNIPANNMVGMSVTFKTGEPFPNWDTVARFVTAPTMPYKYNHFRPLMFEETTGGVPGFYGHFKYADSNESHYNMGYISLYPYTNYEQIYVPSIGLTAPSSAETPYIDFKITCSSCLTIKELSVKESSILSAINAYPNPATNELTIPFTVNEAANVTVSISNLLGQVISTQNVGKVNAGQQSTAVFNTSSLSAGIYLYTVEANGQRVSNRFSVAK